MKKRLLGLSSIVVVVAPVAAVVSCNNNNKNSDGSLGVNLKSMYHVTSQLEKNILIPIVNDYNAAFSKATSLIPSSSRVDFAAPVANLKKLEDETKPEIQAISKRFDDFNQVILREPENQAFNLSSYYYSQAQDLYAQVNSIFDGIIKQNNAWLKNSYLTKLFSLFSSDDKILPYNALAQDHNLDSGRFSWDDLFYTNKDANHTYIPHLITTDDSSAPAETDWDLPFSYNDGEQYVSHAKNPSGDPKSDFFAWFNEEAANIYDKSLAMNDNFTLFKEWMSHLHIWVQNADTSIGAGVASVDAQVFRAKGLTQKQVQAIKSLVPFGAINANTFNQATDTNGVAQTQPAYAPIVDSTGKITGYTQSTIPIFTTSNVTTFTSQYFFAPSIRIENEDGSLRTLVNVTNKQEWDQFVDAYSSNKDLFQSLLSYSVPFTTSLFTFVKPASEVIKAIKDYVPVGALLQKLNDSKIKNDSTTNNSNQYDDEIATKTFYWFVPKDHSDYETSLNTLPAQFQKVKTKDDWDTAVDAVANQFGLLGLYNLVSDVYVVNATTKFIGSDGANDQSTKQASDITIGNDSLQDYVKEQYDNLVLGIL